jgi:hypothetical protein
MSGSREDISCVKRVVYIERGVDGVRGLFRRRMRLSLVNGVNELGI